MIKNIYVRRADETFWTLAQDQADEAGIALSVWLTNLIRARRYDQTSGQVTAPTPLDAAREAQSLLGQTIEMLEADQ